MGVLRIEDICSSVAESEILIICSWQPFRAHYKRNVCTRRSEPSVPARGSWREQQGVIWEPDLSGKIRRVTSTVWGNNDRGGAGSWVTKGQEEEKRFMEPGTRGSNWRKGMEWRRERVPSTYQGNFPRWFIRQTSRSSKWNFIITPRKSEWAHINVSWPFVSVTEGPRVISSRVLYPPLEEFP